MANNGSDECGKTTKKLIENRSKILKLIEFWIDFFLTILVETRNSLKSMKSLMLGQNIKTPANNLCIRDV